MSRRAQKGADRRSQTTPHPTLKSRTKPSQTASLARKRRLHAIDEDVRRVVKKSPKAGARLGAYLAGEIADAKQDRSITVRLPAALIERIESLVHL